MPHSVAYGELCIRMALSSLHVFAAVVVAVVASLLVVLVAAVAHK